MKKRIIIKSVILIAVSIIFTGLNNSISPLIANSLAMMQMNNSEDSSFWIQMYSYLNNYTYLLFIGFVLLLYNKDITNLINFAKEKFKHEETL